MKQDLRREILRKRLLLDSHDVMMFSSLIVESVLTIDCVKEAQCVMAYCAYKNEPNMLALTNSLLDMGKMVSLPYITEDDDLIAVDYNFDSVMKSNIFGIAEPIITNKSEIAVPDVVLVPGIAFDKSGNRIGYGLGYFDRFLKKFDACKIGVCFDLQLVPHVESKPHDVRMDIIVTQSKIIYTNP